MQWQQKTALLQADPSSDFCIIISPALAAFFSSKASSDFTFFSASFSFDPLDFYFR